MRSFQNTHPPPNFEGIHEVTNWFVKPSPQGTCSAGVYGCQLGEERSVLEVSVSPAPFVCILPNELLPSQVKCIDVTQRSVTLVIANPRSFGYEELHTLPKVPEEYY